MNTRLYAVQTALAAGFGSVLAGTAVEQFLGPRPRSGNAPQQFLLIGADGGDTGLNDGLTDDGLVATHEPSDLGPGTWQDETGTVVCAAWAWSGKQDFDPLRTQVQDMFNACAVWLLKNRDLNGLLQLPGLARVTGVRLRETPTSNGPFVRAVFPIAYSALITPEENP